MNSIKIHYIDQYLTGRFHKLDHGPSKNLKLYGNRRVPDYNLTNIQTKVHILYGTNDFLVKPEVFYLMAIIFIELQFDWFHSWFSVSELSKNHKKAWIVSCCCEPIEWIESYWFYLWSTSSYCTTDNITCYTKAHMNNFIHSQSKTLSLNR